MIAYMTTGWDLFLSFGKIGFLSFGGGNSMLKMIEYEAVGIRSWITPEEFSQITGVTFLFPGLTAVKLSTIIGFKVGGALGAFAAFIAMNLPGLILAIFGFYILKTYEENAGVQKILILVQYGALAVLIAAVYAVAFPILKENFSIIYVLGAVALLLAMIIFNLSPFLGLLLYVGVFFFI